MKIRSSHVVVLVGAVIFGFVLFAALRTRQTPNVSTDAPESGERPKMVIDQTVIDMGTISNSEPTQHIVKIRNEGRAPLRILSVQGSCPCITGRMDKTTILPGGTGDLIIELDPNRDVYSFAFQKSVTVRSNDPSLDFILLDVHGKIDPEFTIEPTMFDFGIVPKGQTVEKTILLRQMQEAPVELTGLDLGAHPLEGLEVSFAERPKEEWTNPDKKEYIITARLLPEAPPGRLAEYVRLVTNCKRFPKGFPVVVAAEVTSFFTTEPARVLQLGKVAPGEELPAKVTISAASPITVSEVTFSGKDLTAVARPGERPESAYIDFTVSPNAGSGRIKGSLRFIVTSGDQSAPANITVFGLIQPK